MGYSCGHVFKGVVQFFNSGHIFPNWNSNLVVLIPKVSGANSIENFGSIALANFKFKIVTKILMDRLSIIVPKIISPEQHGFVKGR